MSLVKQSRAKQILTEKYTSFDFACNFCFESPTEPIVTFCGHVFCWPCYYILQHAKKIPCCPTCNLKVSLYEFVSLKVTNECERTKSEKIMGVLVPPFSEFLKIRNDKEMLRKVRNKKYNGKKEQDVIYVLRVKRAYISLSVVCVMAFVIYLYVLKEMLLNGDN
ncbi:hypothetical protein GVAV_000122 [Gurleya vavrai]